MYRQSEKNLLSSNTCSTCPDNMVSFGLLTAEIGSGVWDTLQISTGFASWQRYSASSSSGRQPNFAALNRGRHLYIRQGDHQVGHWPTFLVLSSSSFFFFSPNLSRRRLDVCHTSTHGVALVRISDACLKPAARGSLKTQDAKKSPKITIWAPSYNFVGLYLRN